MIETVTRNALSDQELEELGWKWWSVAKFIVLFGDGDEAAADRKSLRAITPAAIDQLAARARELRPIVAARGRTFVDPETMPDVREHMAFSCLVIARTASDAGWRFWERLTPQEHQQALAHMPTLGAAPTPDNVARGISNGYLSGAAAWLGLYSGHRPPPLQEMFPYIVGLDSALRALSEVTDGSVDAALKKAVGIKRRGRFGF